MKELKQKKLFLLDMDGTIYLDNTLFDGTLDFLEYVKSIGGRYMFLTNNSSKSVDKYIEKLKSLGIDSCKEDFFTSSQATVVYLNENMRGKKVYALGTESFKKELANADVTVTDSLEDDIDALVMGFDTELTFKKLEDACILLNRGVEYIATNPDWVCPTWYGYVPDCGSVSQMLCNATKRMPKFIGKPEPAMIELAISKTDFLKDEAIILGDRIYTDIASGVNAGISTVLMLSGETKREDMKDYDITPEYVYNNIREFYNDLIR